MFRPNKFIKSLAFIVSVLTISLSLGYLVSAWTEPTVAPPTGNVSTPLNVSSIGQSKAGGLILNTGGAPNGLIVQSGDVLIGSAVTIKGDGSVSTGLNSAKIGGYTAADLMAAGGADSYPVFAGTFFDNGGDAYYCRKKVVDATGFSTISKINEGKTCAPSTVCVGGNCQNASPSAVTGLSPNAGDTIVNLSWLAPTNNGSAITNYKIYKGTSSGGETLLTTVGNVLTYTNIGLTNGTTYYYKVSAVNGIGEGPQSAEGSAVPATTPSVVTGLSGTSGDAQVALSWSAPTNNGGAAITSYKIYQGTTSGGETLLTIVGGIGYTITGLIADTTYYYKVSAVNVMGEGPQSAEASAKAGGYHTSVNCPGFGVYYIDVAASVYSYDQYLASPNIGCLGGGRWPTTAELTCICWNKPDFGNNFIPDWYWSSNAEIVRFLGTCVTGGTGSWNQKYVRCVK